MKDESKLNCGAREVPKRAQGVAWLRPSLLASFKLGNLEEEIQIKTPPPGLSPRIVLWLKM